MNVATLTYPSVLSAVFALLFVTTFMTLLAVRRRIHRQDGDLRRLLELLASRAETPLPAAGEDIGRVTDAIEVLATRVEALNVQQTAGRRAGGPGALDDAAAMARAGNTAQEIATRCGIAVGEAELLVRVQQADPHAD